RLGSPVRWSRSASRRALSSRRRSALASCSLLLSSASATRVRSAISSASAASRWTMSPSSACSPSSPSSTTWRSSAVLYALVALRAALVVRVKRETLSFSSSIARRSMSRSRSWSAEAATLSSQPCWIFSPARVRSSMRRRRLGSVPEKAFQAMVRLAGFTARSLASRKAAISSSSSRRPSCASRVTAPGSGADRARPEAPCPPNRSQRNAGKTDAEEVGAPSAILPLRRRRGKFKAAPRYFRTAPASLRLDRRNPLDFDFIKRMVRAGRSGPRPAASKGSGRIWGETEMRVNLTQACSAYLLASVAACALAPAAAAQETSGENRGASDAFGQAIVVTAERRETNLQDTPISIVAVTEEIIAAKGIEDLADLGSFTPNLNITPSRGNGSAIPSFSIRGISGGGGATSERGVGLYIDGVYVPRTSGSVLRVLDIDRIEVLRGPPGTLFGRNSTGGAIRIFPRQPEFDDLNGYAKVTAGNLGRFDVVGALNVPVSSTLALRVQGARLHEGGF